MNTITLDFDYTRNGVVEWAKGVAHDATDELRQLLAAGVAGTESKVETEEGAAANQVEASPQPSAAVVDAESADAGVQTSAQTEQQ